MKVGASIGRWKCVCAFALLLTQTTIGSQFGDLSGSRTVDVRGEVVADGPLTGADYLRVELHASGGAVGRLLSGDVHSDGSFVIQNVPPGSYELRLTNLHGAVIKRDFVTVLEAGNHLTIRLPEVKRERPAGGTVSLAQLQHKVPEAALKAMKASEKAMEKKDLQGSLRHLQKAVEIDPEYLQARNNLGARYLQLDQPEKALEQFEKALELDERSPLIHSNLSLVFMIMRREADAENSARRAVELDGTLLKARYVLGMALVRQEKYTDEAVTNLQHAAEQFPRSRLGLAQIYSKRSQLNDARDQLEKYLAEQKDAPDREQIVAWMSRLRPAD